MVFSSCKKALRFATCNSNLHKPHSNKVHTHFDNAEEEGKIRKIGVSFIPRQWTRAHLFLLLIYMQHKCNSPARKCFRAIDNKSLFIYCFFFSCFCFSCVCWLVDFNFQSETLMISQLIIMSRSFLYRIDTLNEKCDDEIIEGTKVEQFRKTIRSVLSQ